MRVFHSMKLIALSGLVCFAISGGANAGSLGETVGGLTGGLGTTVGGITGGTGTSVSNVTGSVTTTVSNVTSPVAGETVAPLSGTPNRALFSANAKANILGGVRAKLRVLDEKRLLKLCLSVGGGNGCGSPSRRTVTNLINARINVLSPEQLLSVCLSVGANGCGSVKRNARPVVTGPVTRPDKPAPGAVVDVSSRSADDDDIAITCAKVMRSPRSYEAGLVKLCRKTAAY